MSKPASTAPSLADVVENDRLSVIYVVVGLSGVCVTIPSIVCLWLGHGDPMAWAAVAISTALPTACAASLLAFRIWLIHCIFEAGATITGIVAHYSSNWRTVELVTEYEWNGSKIAKSHWRNAAQPKREYRVGDCIELIVDERDPRRSFVRDWFVAPSELR
jgi:hypothetical protein